MRRRAVVVSMAGVLVGVCVFVAGMTAGVYYYQELMVWWLAWRTDVPVATATPTTLPAVSPDTSVLELPGLDAPLPLVYSDTLEEPVIQQYLRQGAVVLPLGTSFGEAGNVVVTAHSSGAEAFGPYRFAFARLSELEPGQEYTVRTPAATYVYKVYAKEVVWPHEVDKLPQDERATVTLVTCWPLWTNLQRLLVHTELVRIAYNV